VTKRVAIVQNVTINDHRMIHIDGVSRELVKRGYEVEVFIQESDEEPQFRNRSYKTTWLPGDTYSMMGQLRFTYNLLRKLKKNAYDIVHAKNPFSSVFPALLLRPIGGKAKIIYDVRGLWIDFGIFSGRISSTSYALVPVLNKLDTLCMNKADEVISISHELKDILVKRGVEKRKIYVIVGDGVDFQKAKQAKKKEIRDVLSIDGKVIGYVGSIGKARSSERIVEAFEIVKKQTDLKANLVMMGSINEDYKDYLQKLIRQKKVEDCVFLTGFVPHDEVLEYMKSFDVAVAYHEGDFQFYNVAVPTKILEYMATGRGIVTTNHKMYRNLLTHGKDAYLTEQNPKAFADGIIRILENDELSKRLSKNAQITAEKHSFEKITDKVEKVYESVLNHIPGGM